MLKLERGKERQIKLSVRRREAFFNRTLLLALALAFGIHFTGSVLFKIKPLKIVVEEQMLPPVAVRTEVAVSGSVSAHTGCETCIKDSFLEPTITLPSIPKRIGEANSLPVVTKLKSSKNPFAAHENELLNFTMDETKDQIIGYQPVQVHVVGALRERLYPLHLVDEELISAPVEKQRARFAVRVDDNQGTIFWFEPLELPTSKTYVAQSEELLKKLRFRVQKNSMYSVGEVEFIFTRKV